MKYPWYSIIESNSELQQGDFVKECPIIIPPDTFRIEEELDVDIKLMDVIVLSQSCDLVNNKLEIVMVCPYYPLKTFLNGLSLNSKKETNSVIDNLKKGHLPAYHLLNKFENYLDDYLVVDFRNIYGVHLKALRSIVLSFERRVRLESPYKEHLSQSFARFFMRIGLPQDLNIENNDEYFPQHTKNTF